MQFAALRQKLWRRAAPHGLSLLVLVLALAAQLYEPPLRIALRNAAFDALQRWQPRVYQPVPVRIIDIDEASLAKFGQWPWPRTKLAQLVEALRHDGAAAIAFDIVFAEADRTSPARVVEQWLEGTKFRDLAKSLPDHDQVFADAIGGGRVVTGFILTDEPSATAPPVKAAIAFGPADPKPFLPTFHGAIGNLPEIQAKAAGEGALSFIADGDGVIRNVSLVFRYGNTLYPSLAAEALRVAAGSTATIIKTSPAGVEAIRVGRSNVTTDAKARVWLHFAPPDPARYIPAWQVLDGSVPKDKIAGAILFIGTSAKGLQDLRFSPLGQIIPGVEIHAQLVEQVLTNSYLVRPDWARGTELLLLLLGGAMLLLLIPRLGAIWAAVAGLAMVAAACLAALYAFSAANLLFEPLYPSVALVAIYFTASVSRYRRTEREHRWIRQAFSSYVSRNLVEHLIKHPEQLRLGGERRECTFVLTDLAGFTGLVERSDPTAIIGLLNEYLEQMMAIAFRHDGTLDKIVGDAVAIMFSAPVTQPDHAARGIACAMAMDDFARGFRQAKIAAGIPLGATRIGVNSGSVIVGNVGGSTVFDYRPLGDAINTASRLESVNRHLGTRVCASGATVAACPDFHGRPVGNLRLKGKQDAIPVYEPLTAAEQQSPAVQTYLAAYRLLAANDPAAAAAFAAAADRFPDDPLIRFHARRLAAGETGVDVVMDEK